MEDRAIASQPPPEGQDEAQTMLQTPEDRQRVALAGRIILIGALFCAIAIIPYVPLYSQTGAWQILLGVAGILLGALCLTPARNLARRGKLEASGYWVLAALAVTFGTGELAWSDATLNQTASFILLMVLAATVYRPRRWGIWLVSAIVYVLYVYAVNELVPWPRFDIVRRSPISQATPLALALVLVWQISSGVTAGSIRSRLLVAFVTMVLLPVAAVGVAVGIVGTQTVQERLMAQIELVNVIREGELNVWISSLQTDLDDTLAQSDLALFSGIVLQESNIGATSEFQEALGRSLQYRLDEMGAFEELLVLNLQGRVVVSTDATHEGTLYSTQMFFLEGLRGAYVQPPYYSSSLDETLVFVARPIGDDFGRVQGILAGLASSAELNEIMAERTGLGETGKAYLVDQNQILLTESQFCEPGTHVSTQGANAAIQDQTSGSGAYQDYRGERVIGAYHWLPELGVALLAEQDESEALIGVYVMLAATAGVAVLAGLGATVASFFVTRSIARPLADLADAATQITAGDLERTVSVKRKDEIGALGKAFNTMTAQLRGLIGTLEQRVLDRTSELERRSGYLEASAEVARAAASILDVDVLIRQVVELIRERFDLYYVGLFMVDATGKWAVLRAGTGEAGSAMLARDHRHRVGEGMIGWSIAHAESRVALEAGEDTVRLTTPELPHTRSEAALPLQSRNRVIGALTVQHTEPGAFDQETVTVLQVMADQVAVAIDNARLFAETQEALDVARRAYGELSRKAWIELLTAAPELGFRSSEGGVVSAEDSLSPVMEQALVQGETVPLGPGKSNDRYPLAVPIKIRGSVVGALDTYKPLEEGEWTPDEINLLEAMAEQLGTALEGARLYEEAQRRAARERLTREITDRMRSTTEVQNIIQAAVDELFGVLDASRVFVRLGQSHDWNDDGTDGRDAP